MKQITFSDLDIFLKILVIVFCVNMAWAFLVGFAYGFGL